jgi:hypothetical protein
MAHFDRTGDENLVMHASAFTTRPTANPRFVDLDMLARQTADPVLVWPHHGRAKLMEKTKGSLIA